MAPGPKTTPRLFKQQSDCCGCGACASACPKNAIDMITDSHGFKYPVIRPSLCIGCNNCINSCGLQLRLGQKTKGPWFAGAGKADISKSASGGTFSALANSIINKGGCVYGAAYDRTENEIHVCHQRAASNNELKALLNSKYVQSDAKRCFKDVKEQLKTGRAVFFTGTPCQVAGLKGYLKKDWPNLLTADLVCHGVPSDQLFNDQIHSYEKQYGAKVIDFCFRDKTKGWGHSLIRLTLSDMRTILIPADECPYYDLFLKVKTLRDSCYNCPYSSDFRAADITLGDFWGVEESRPDVLYQSGLTTERGVSCIMANTEKGRLGIQKYGGGLIVREVAFDDIAKFNDQLRHPSRLPKDRDLYLKRYEKDGWSGIETTWGIRERGVTIRIKTILKRHLSTKSLLRLKKLYKKVRH